MTDPILEATAVVFTRVVTDYAAAGATGEQINELLSELTGIPIDELPQLPTGDWT